MLLGEVITFIDDPRAEQGPGTKKPAQLVGALVVKVEPDAETLFGGSDGWYEGVEPEDLRWLHKPAGNGMVVCFSTILLPSIEQQALDEGGCESEESDSAVHDDVDDGIANLNRHTVPTGFQRITTRDVRIDLGRVYAVEVVERKSRHTLPPRVSRSKTALGRKAGLERAVAERQKGLFGQ
jgi:hypothetical protein